MLPYPVSDFPLSPHSFLPLLPNQPFRKCRYSVQLACSRLFTGLFLMFIGYVRVSTNDQNTALQRNELECAGCELIFEDKISGKTSIRLAGAKEVTQNLVRGRYACGLETGSPRVSQRYTNNFPHPLLMSQCVRHRPTLTNSPSTDQPGQ
ncbi:DNA-invertase [Escherichia coli KTE213]|nr:DNA-invertase [Escherichia coli KTE213]ELG71748.1 DNA-invertase [Escherichia coli KTE140]ELJ83685.1 DNA-invertase [Escherichia coli KTE95]